MMPINVVPVRTRRDRDAFVAFPYKLYARDPAWIAPMRSSIRRALDPSRNPFHREALIEPFLARDARGECVGRVAAILHPAHVRRHGSKAFFGQFECENDPRIAERLLRAVETWADDRGIRVVQGPCTYAMTQEAGLLVEGFEHASVVLQAHNPPYYQELLRAAGYESAFHMSTFTISRDSAAVAHAVRRGDAAAERLGVSVRSINMQEFDRELERIRLCYNRAFSMHPETAAISRDVFADQAREMKDIVDPRLVRIVEKDGTPVAFAVAIPNVNELLAPTRGRLTLRLLLRFKELLARVRSVVVVMIGADPDAAGEDRSAATAQGIGSVLAAQLAHGLSEGGYDVVHTTWIHERNWRAQMLMRSIGAREFKRYAVLQKELT
jgi:hypothetical protein